MVCFVVTTFTESANEVPSHASAPDGALGAAADIDMGCISGYWSMFFCAFIYAQGLLLLRPLVPNVAVFGATRYRETTPCSFPKLIWAIFWCLWCQLYVIESILGAFV